MLTFENSLNFRRGEQPEAVLRNFWEPEDGFIWSTGKWCEVSFAFDPISKVPSGNIELILDIDAFKVTDRFIGQNLMLYLNGMRIGSFFCTKRATVIFSFDSKLLIKGENMLTIDTPDASTPSEYDIPDTRSLGLQLFSFQFRKTG